MLRSKPTLAALLMAALFGAFTAPLFAEDAAKKLKIATVIFQEDQFFRLVQFGMKDAGEKAGAEVFSGNSDSKADKEAQLISTYITKKVDAIVISPLSTKSSGPALKKAKDAGIKIVTYNTTIDGDTASSYIESDQRDLGKKTGAEAAKYITEKLGGKAKVAIIAFKAAAAEQSDARTGGFKEELAKLPGVEIVAEQDAWLPEPAVKKAGDILTANKDLNLIFAANEGGTIGSVIAVKNAHREGKVVVFGTDTGKQISDFLLSNDNILQAVTGQAAFEMGTMAVETAIKAAKGEKVDAKVTMPGILLVRGKPEEVKAFQAKVDAILKK
jgi:ABC-type sugar transport system substrate-binding protein